MRLDRAARSAAKWACTVGLIVIASAFTVSRWYTVEARQILPSSTEDQMYGPHGRRQLVLWQGCLSAAIAEESVPDYPRGTPAVVVHRNEGPGWHWTTETFGAPGLKGVCISLWIPFSMLAVPAWVLWQGDLRLILRKHRRSCLGCGYDRRGLAVGVKCPECGGLPAS